MLPSRLPRKAHQPPCLQAVAGIGAGGEQHKAWPGAIAHRQLDAEEAAAMLASLPERAAVTRLPALTARAFVPQLVRAPLQASTIVTPVTKG